MAIYLPLNGPGHKKPKAPKASSTGWSRPDYAGVDPADGGWVGRRCDDLVVIDCDSDAARDRWAEIASTNTYSVKTPRGWHFYYKFVPGSPTGPDADIFRDGGGIDIRVGNGSYVVAPPTPGYVEHKKRMAAFKPAWVPQRDASSVDVDEWDVIPEGRRNDTLAALAGSFRRQGMSVKRIFQLLIGLNNGLCDPPLERDELELIARSAGRYEPQPDWEITLDGEEVAPEPEADDSSLLMWMSEMELPPPAEWHWKPYLPKGRLVLLDGSEGIGKGLFCVSLAMTLAQRSETVLWMSAEDDPEEDIQKRLLAAGYKANRHGRIGFFTFDLRFPPHTGVLEDIIANEDASLVVMDPGRSFLAPPDGTKGGLSYNDEAHVRPGLEALNRMAKRTGCTILFVHHWNKNTATTVQYRSGGAGAFAQVVRHRITVAWHGPTEGGSGAFEVSKSNIGPKGSVHTYSIEPDDALDTAKFVLGKPMPTYADLGAWMKSQEDEDRAIEIDRDDEIVEDLLALPGGTAVTASELIRDWQISDKQARSVLDRLSKDGELRKHAKGYTRIGGDER